MVDVTTFGTTTLKKIKANTINGVADTNKNPDERRTITFISNDDTGIGSSLFFELKLGGTITLNELYFSPEAKMRNIQSNGVGTLIPRSTIDTFVSGNFTLYPIKLVTPMDFGWGVVPGNNIFSGSMDAGALIGGHTNVFFNSMFIINKPIPTSGKVYIELEVIYSGSGAELDGSGSVTNHYLGFTTQNAYDSVTLDDSWANDLAAVSGTAFVKQSFDVFWNSRNAADTIIFNADINNSADGYLDTTTNSGKILRNGTKLQIGYDTATDILEVIIFDGIGTDGSVHGIRFRYKFPGVTQGNYVDNGTAYFTIIPCNYANTVGNEIKIALSKNKVGYYLGDLTDMIELI